MRMERSLLRRCVAVAATTLYTSVSWGATYDLADDWSDASNPAGPWTYGTRSGSGIFAAFALHVPSYINVGPSAFVAPQPAWTHCANTGNNGCPEGLAQSIGVAIAGVDFPSGRVGGHTPVAGALAVQWTAPSSGVVDISGGTWMWLDFEGRRLVHSLYLNGVSIFESVLIPTYLSGTTSANPLSFTQSVIAVGGTADALRGIAISAGDTITWATQELPGSVEWVAGIDLTISLVPEPASGALGLVGLLTLSAWRAKDIRRRRQVAPPGSSFISAAGPALP
jgi:hypothetical protein